MILLLFFWNDIRCTAFVIDHLIKNYTNLISTSAVTCTVCILLSCIIMYKGASQKVVSMTIILGLIFILLYEDMTLYLLKKYEEAGHLPDEQLNGKPFITKMYGYLLRLLKYGHDNSYVTLSLFLVLSYFITSTIDLSIYLYIAYLIFNFIDSSKTVYLKNVAFGSAFIFGILAIVIVHHVVSYTKALLYSLFYSTIGSSCFLIGIEVLSKKDLGFSKMYGELMEKPSFSNYKICILTNIVLILASSYIQVKDVYLK